MKKIWVAMGLASVLSVNAQAIDLLGALKKASDTIDKAQATVDQTAAAASAVTTSPEQSALALVKAKLGNNATKAQVTNLLGAPLATGGSQTAEVWFYDVSALNATLAQTAQIAAALGVSAAATATKQIAIQFAEDTVSQVTIADPAVAE